MRITSTYFKGYLSGHYCVLQRRENDGKNYEINLETVVFPYNSKNNQMNFQEGMYAQLLRRKCAAYDASFLKIT